PHQAFYGASPLPGGFRLCAFPDCRVDAGRCDRCRHGHRHGRIL
ncbi:hypothetical protein SAMN05660745_02666, partial [Corynebacterium glucuronolyticum]